MEAGNWSGQNINDSKYLETGLIIKTKLGKGIMKGFTDHIISLVIFFKFFAIKMFNGRYETKCISPN